MLEAKDPAIKLFGKTIPVAENPAYPGEFPGPGDGCSGPVVDDAMDHDHASSTNSSFEDNTNRDGGEREIDKVSDFALNFSIEKVTPFFWNRTINNGFEFDVYWLLGREDFFFSHALSGLLL